MSQLQISCKNTFLTFSSSSRPSFRRARTTIDVCPDSPYSASWSPLSGSYSSPVPSPVSTAASPQNSKKLLDSFAASTCEAEKTTVMIRGIPKHYDQEMLLAEIEATGLPVNFLYLPAGKTKSNRSYGFVNFDTDESALAFLECFDGHRWPDEEKVATCGYATLQGFYQNVAFYSKPEVVKDVCKRTPWIKRME